MGETTCIGIIGRLSSGKTTLARNISEKYSFPIISFGAYLQKYSKERGLPVTRQDLQDLGQSFIDSDSTKFLQEVLLTSSGKDQRICIIEGIRHVAIFESIRELFDNSFFIFCDCPKSLRITRYLNRVKESDLKKDVESFNTADEHPVECEIDVLKVTCDFVVDTTEQIHERMYAVLDHIISKNGNS